MVLRGIFGPKREKVKGGRYCGEYFGPKREEVRGG